MVRPRAHAAPRPGASSPPTRRGARDCPHAPRRRPRTPCMPLSLPRCSTPLEPRVASAPSVPAGTPSATAARPSRRRRTPSAPLPPPASPPPLCIPARDFKPCCTLFPKFFSPFAHATCLLSVSGRYLQPQEAPTSRLTLHSQATRLADAAVACPAARPRIHRTLTFRGGAFQRT